MKARSRRRRIGAFVADHEFDRSIVDSTVGIGLRNGNTNRSTCRLPDGCSFAARWQQNAYAQDAVVGPYVCIVGH